MQKEIKRTLSSKAMAAVWDGKNHDPIYAVERDYGKSGTEGSFYREHSAADIARLIFTGEYENVLTVLEIFEDEHSVRNVTEDIARDVLKLVIDENEEIRSELRNWLERIIGQEAADAIEEAEQTARDWRSDYAEHNTLNRAQQGV